MMSVQTDEDVGIEDAVAVDLITSSWDALEEFPREGSVKFKHTDLDRSTFTRLRVEGIIEKDAGAMGMEARWQLTSYGCRLLDAKERGHGCAERLSELSSKQCETLATHSETLLSLPTDPDESFRARVYGLSRGTLNVLNRRGFIVREERVVGGADEYSITPTLAQLVSSNC